MKRTGRQSSVLNVDPRAPESDAYIKISGGLAFMRELVRHVWNDWSLNVHTNGHNCKSWALALASGVVAQFGPEATMTLHSGMAPAYIRNSSPWTQRGIRLACLLYRQIVCVNEEIAAAVTALGIPKDRIQVSPAFLPVEAPEVALPAAIDGWIQEHTPVLTSTMFFRSEYGFQVLMQAVSRLRSQYPRLGCVVMGDEAARQQASTYVAANQLSDVVFLAGDVDHELCLALMARSSVFVRPTFQDGDSISVREAVALGVPVVASNVGARPEGVLLFEPGDVDGLVTQVERVLGADWKRSSESETSTINPFLEGREK
jgi:glycogen synthase